MRRAVGSLMQINRSPGPKDNGPDHGAASSAGRDKEQPGPTRVRRAATGVALFDE
jgi:hypothetical protein